MKTPTVFVVLDAARWDYINPEDTPFLAELAREGTYGRRLVSTAGFTQRSALLTGAPPDVTGNFTMFVRDPSESPYQFLRPWRPALRELQAVADAALAWAESGPRDSRARRLAHALGKALLHRVRDPAYERSRAHATHMPPSSIPLHLLPEFSVSEDTVPIHEPGAFRVESLFDRMSEAGLSWHYLMFPVVNVDDDGVLETALEAVDDDRNLYLLQFSNPDARMHLHGPDSTERRKVMGEVDRKLRVLRRAFDDRYGAVRWCVIGDHGMTEVRERVDVTDRVGRMARADGVREGRDYQLFLDSTMARAWGLTDRGRQFVASVFEREPFGRLGTVLTDDVAERRRIPKLDRRYGDTIWLADTGVLIYPDYFHDRGKRNVGMHGYASSHPDMQGFCVAAGPGVPNRTLESVSLLDVCPTLASMVGVEPPAAAEGRNLIAEPR